MRDNGYPWTAIGIIALFAVFLIYLNPFYQTQSRIVFLDVGQGDAVFIESPSGFQTLVDTGRGNKVLQELGKVMRLNDRDIDVVIITHPDGDHIGGLMSVLKRFAVRHIIIPDTDDINRTHTTAAWKSARIIVPPVPSRLTLPDGTVFEFLWGIDNKHMSESNARSIVVRIAQGDRSVLLTGDIPAAIEQELVARHGDALHSDILKLSHHGSKTSSHPLFLKTVAPSTVVVSAGATNRFGHPHQEVIERVETLLPNATVRYTGNGAVPFNL